MPRVMRRQRVVGMDTSTTRRVSRARSSSMSRAARRAPSRRPRCAPVARPRWNFSSRMASRSTPRYGPTRTNWLQAGRARRQKPQVAPPLSRLKRSRPQPWQTVAPSRPFCWSVAALRRRQSVGRVVSSQASSMAERAEDRVLTAGMRASGFSRLCRARERQSLLGLAGWRCSAAFALEQRAGRSTIARGGHTKPALPAPGLLSRSWLIPHACLTIRSDIARRNQGLTRSYSAQISRSLDAYPALASASTFDSS